MDDVPVKPKRSPMFYVGIGCAVIAAIMVVMMGACGVWIFSEVRQLEQDMNDPEARADAVLDILGTDELPDGYYPMVGMSVPFVMRTAILTSRGPDADGGPPETFGERGFIFAEMIRFGRRDEARLRDYFEGRIEDSDVLSSSGINIDVDEVIGRGTFDLAAGRAMHVTQRGSISAQGHDSDGLTALTLVDCPDDDRLRLAIWFAQEESAASTADDASAAAAETSAAPESPANTPAGDLAGTPADEAALAAFLGNFRLCPAP